MTYYKGVNEGADSSVILNWEKTSETCGLNIDLRKSATSGYLTDEEDYSRTFFRKLSLTGFRQVTMVSDVRHISVTANSNGRPYYENKSAVVGSIYLTDNKPFELVSNSDSSYTLTARYRTYKLRPERFPVYVLTEVTNSDEDGELPVLLKANAVVERSVDKLRLHFQDPYSLVKEYDLLGVLDHLEEEFDIGRVVRYSIDNTTLGIRSKTYRNEDVILLEENTEYTLRFLSEAKGWTSSEEQTVTFNTADIPLVLSSDIVIKVLPDDLENVNFLADSNYLGYELLSIELSSATLEEGEGVVYSLDSGVTYRPYTASFSLPANWKPEQSKSNFPAVLAHKVRNGRKSSTVIGKKINFNLSNISVELFSDEDMYLFRKDAEGLNFTITETNSYSFSRVYLDNIYINKTTLEDKRYLEVYVDTLLDSTKMLKVSVNGVVLSQNGVITDQNSRPPVETLKWGQGDTVRIELDYKTGSVRFRVDEGPWSQTFIKDSEIEVKVKYVDQSDASVTGSSFTFKTKESEFNYQILESGVLPFGR